MWILSLALAWASLNDCKTIEGPLERAERWSCVYAEARNGARDEALAYAEASAALGTHGQVLLTYGNLLDLHSDERALAVYQHAADAFETEGNAKKQLFSYLNLANGLRHRGKLDEARDALAKGTLASGTDEALLSIVQLETARFTLTAGGDYVGAYRTLLTWMENTDERPAHAVYAARHTLAALARLLGRAQEAADGFAALAEWSLEQDDAYRASSARTNELLVRSEEHLDDDDALWAFAEDALNLAQSSDNAPAEADITCWMAARSAEHAPRCLELAQELDLEDLELEALLLTTTDLAPIVERARALGLFEIEAMILRKTAAQSPADELELLALADSVRNQQSDALHRARAFDRYRADFQRAASRRLRSGDLQGALTILERSRGAERRVRLDGLGASWGEEAWSTHQQAVKALQEEPTRANRLAESAARDALMSAQPALQQLEQPTATLEALQQALQPGESMILVVAGENPAALVISAESAQAVELGSIARVDAVMQLVQQGSPLATEKLADLRKALWEPITAPERLIVVPDPELASVSWAALSGLPTTIAPTATGWLGQRTKPHELNPSMAFLGAPEAELPPQLTRQASGVLPYAEKELAELAKRYPEATLLVGKQATEAAAQQAATTSGLLHIAAHATVDTADPEGSAIHLSDGPWQVREVLVSDLPDSVVLLSACSAAGGESLGAGVVGLADAFLQRGARAVVANRWPISDKLAEQAFTQLHDELAKGIALDEAVAAVRTNLPPAAAAGLVVLGDGAVTVQAASSPIPWLPVAVGSLGILLLGGGAWRRWT